MDTRQSDPFPVRVSHADAGGSCRDHSRASYVPRGQATRPRGREHVCACVCDVCVCSCCLHPEEFTPFPLSLLFIAPLFLRRTALLPPVLSRQQRARALGRRRSPPFRSFSSQALALSPLSLSLFFLSLSSSSLLPLSLALSLARPFFRHPPQWRPPRTSSSSTMPT